MIRDIEGVVKGQLNPREKLIWHGQPVTSKTVKTLQPIETLLLTFSLAFFGYAIYIIAFDIVVAHQAGRLYGDQVYYAVRNILLALFGGVFFLGFRHYLPQNFYSENNVIYAVTDQRALIIKRDQKDQKKFKISDQWGAGDVKKASLKKRGDSSGDIWFAEDFVQLGDKDDGGRKPVGWRGFDNVEDVAGAFNALKEWEKVRRQKTYQVDNEGLGFSIGIPPSWTANSFLLKPEHRDNTFIALLSGEVLDDDGQLLRGAKIGKKWNTLVLTKRQTTDRKEDSARHKYISIIIDAALRKEIPEGDSKFSVSNKDVNLGKFFEDKDQLTIMMKRSITIFEFNDACVQDKKTKKWKVRYNARAKEVDYNNGMRCFDMPMGNIKIMNRGFKFRHVYCYRVIPWDDFDPELCLHIRLSFLCYDSEKDKVYNGNNKVLNDIAASIKILNLPEEEEAPAEEKPADKPKPKARPKK